MGRFPFGGKEIKRNNEEQHGGNNKGDREKKETKTNRRKKRKNERSQDASGILMRESNEDVFPPPLNGVFLSSTPAEGRGITREEGKGTGTL